MGKAARKEKKAPAVIQPGIESEGFFKGVKDALVHGDVWVKLSLLVWGIGYARRKQYVKAVIVTALQILALWFIICVGWNYLKDFGTLGTVQQAMVYNPVTKKNEINNYDNSFSILLFSVITIIVIIATVFFWMKNLRDVYRLQLQEEEGKHINTFREDVRSYLNEKFHITLLSLPILGVVMFSIVPLFILIAVAFTNYDQAHMPPASLFTWVGFNNFKQLFSTGLSLTFGYSFGKVLTWTLIWAFFATLTTYFGGIFVAKFLNNKQTKLPGLWRTLLVLTIAVPQFVSLLVVRNFFGDYGIMNTMMNQAGVTDFLKKIGLVASNLDHIPFLTSPGWAKFTIIMINIWIGIPYQMLVATGVLLNIPNDMLESAKIDGANAWQSFWHITMPYMFAVTGPQLVTDFVKNINNFNVIYLLTQDVYVTHDQALAASNAKEIDLLVTWLFRLTQEYYNYKMAAVIGIFVFIVCAAFTLVSFGFLTRGDKEKEFQ